MVSGWFKHTDCALYFYYYYIRSSGVISQKLGTPALHQVFPPQEWKAYSVHTLGLLWDASHICSSYPQSHICILSLHMRHFCLACYKMTKLLIKAMLSLWLMPTPVSKCQWPVGFSHQLFWMSLCRQTTQTAANVTWRRARARSNRKEGPTLTADGAFLSKFILQNKLIIITKNSYEAGNCQVLQDQFHEHFPDQPYKIALATLQRVSVTCTRVGMQVLRGSLKVQNHCLSVPNY